MRPAETEAATPGILIDVLELCKARITVLVLVSTAMGYLLAEKSLAIPRPLDLPNLLGALVGATLVSLGINVINQWMERDIDALMIRTANRPLPAGRLNPSRVFIIALALTLLGLVILFYGTNTITGFIGVAVVVLYLLVYTPLKRRTQWNTFVGAIPGALPPVLGWSAALGRIDFQAMVLFMIMFFWQYPHFFPVAWLYRKDYLRGGLVMISVTDQSGGRLRRSLLFWTVILILTTIMPYAKGFAGPVYLWGAMILGGAFLWVAVRMSRNLNETTARWMLKASVIYLPLLFLLLFFDFRVL
ncbi:MAG: heme o synthase [Deltaproteobacteria bacterium]|nr:heme o synthase [Deltaproteobacteria bacterium]